MYLCNCVIEIVIGRRTSAGLSVVAVVVLKNSLPNSPYFSRHTQAFHPYKTHAGTHTHTHTHTQVHSC